MGESSARTLQNPARPRQTARILLSSSLHLSAAETQVKKKKELLRTLTEYHHGKTSFYFFINRLIISGLFSVSRLTHRRPCEKLTKAIWITAVPLPCRSFPNNTGCRSSCWSPVLRCGPPEQHDGQPGSGIQQNIHDQCFGIRRSSDFFYGAYAVLAIFASILLEDATIRRASSSGWGST